MQSEEVAEAEGLRSWKEGEEGEEGLQGQAAAEGVGVEEGPYLEQAAEVAVAEGEEGMSGKSGTMVVEAGEVEAEVVDWPIH